MTPAFIAVTDDVTWRDLALCAISGCPVLKHIILAAQACTAIDKVFVISQDARISALAERAGSVAMPYFPNEIERNPTLPAVIAGALNKVSSEYGICECFVNLDAYSPLLSTADINNCFALYAQEGTQSVISVVESELVPGRFWALDSDIENADMKPYYVAADPFKRRQEQDSAYVPNYAISICETQAFMADGGSSFRTGLSRGCEMSDKASVRITSPRDYAFVKALMEGEAVL